MFNIFELTPPIDQSCSFHQQGEEGTAQVRKCFCRQMEASKNYWRINWQTTSSYRENTSYKKPYIWYLGTLMFKLRIYHIWWEIHSKLMVFPKNRLHVKVLWLTRKTYMGTTMLSTIKKIGDNCFLQNTSSSEQNRQNFLDLS